MNTWMTVAETAAALIALGPDLQDYEVWTESDPSGPIDRPEHWWIEHDRKVVHI